MQELQAAFLADAPRRIQNLHQDLNKLQVANPTEHPELVRKLFRQLHTLKGSAAAFDFASVSRIAHELENFLEIINAENFDDSIGVLKEGLREIESAFAENGENSLSSETRQKLENWRAIRQSSNRIKAETAEQIALPFDLEKRLNSTEIKRLRQALKSYSALVVVSVKFTAAGFAAGFCHTQTKLNRSGEIVATLPDAAKTNSAEIALRLIFVCNESAENIAELITDSNAEIVGVFENKAQCRKDFSGDMPKAKLSNLWALAVLAGQKTAAAQGKKVDFQQCESAEVELDGVRAEACEIALLHIARNAAVHGIETPEERRKKGKNECGTVCLDVRHENDSLCLQIRDDGRGINAEKVWRLAKERNLIAGNSPFDKSKAAQIIFLSGFSTAAAVTEDAGRGVGLDAVETAIRATGGTIEVSSEPSRGTTFLIRFPAADENAQN